LVKCQKTVLKPQHCDQLLTHTRQAIHLEASSLKLQDHQPVSAKDEDDQQRQYRRKTPSDVEISDVCCLHSIAWAISGSARRGGEPSRRRGPLSRLKDHLKPALRLSARLRRAGTEASDLNELLFEFRRGVRGFLFSQQNGMHCIEVGFRHL